MKTSMTYLICLLLFGCGTIEDKAIENSSKDKTNINPDSSLETGWYYIVDTNNGFKRQLDKDTSFFFINPTPIVTAKNIIAFEIYESKYGDIGLSMKLDDEGTIAWSEATAKSVGMQLAFIVDDKLLHTPKVNSQIILGMTALNRSVYTKHELLEIQKRIEN